MNIVSWADPSDAPKLRNGGVQFSDDSHDPSVAGWLATNAAAAQTSQPPLSSSSSSSTGTLRRGTGTATNDRQPAPGDAARHWNDVSPKPFSYTHHHPYQQHHHQQQSPPPQPPHHVRVRPEPIELNGAEIKEKLMMSSGHIPESCVWTCDALPCSVFVYNNIIFVVWYNVYCIIEKNSRYRNIMCIILLLL